MLFGGGKKSTQIKELLASGAMIVDVRTPGEFQGGHAKGAVNIPVQKIGSQMGKLSKQKQPIILCCRSGARAAGVAAQLQKEGISCINAGPWQKVSQLQ
jgi:rhodanese-related sulfurtransferase